jgi:hypothetical protein
MAFCWLFSLGCAGWALRQPAAKFGALIGSLGAGTGAALACLSKNTGWLLALSLLCACLGRSQAARWRTLAPWAGCAVFAILTAPLIEWWLTRGSSVQLVPEVSWQTAASAVVQPFLTATPPFLYAGGVVLRELFGPNRRSPVDRLFRLSIVVPIVPLALLAIFTTGDAEWVTPALLTLSVHSARAPAVARGLVRTCIGAGAAIALLGWCWLRTDLPWHTGQLLGGYEPWLDASNDFYAWGPGRELLEGAVTSARERTGQNPVVVGPHWSVCAQADVALAGRVHVGCNTVELDDYDNWSHPARWSDAATVLFVTDSRFHATPPETFQGRPPVAVHGVSVDRFERSVRHISVTEFDRESATAMGSTPAPRGPPAR